MAGMLRLMRRTLSGLRGTACGLLVLVAFFLTWSFDVGEMRWSFLGGESLQAGTPDGFRFLQSSGFARLAPEAVAKPLYDVLRRAAEALLQERGGSARSAELQ